MYSAKEKNRMDRELGRFKQEIDLFNLACQRYGFDIDYSKCSNFNVKNQNNIVLKNSSHRILVSKKDIWMYWDVHENQTLHGKSGGDIIHFVQWLEGGINIGQARKVLRPYIHGSNLPSTSHNQTLSANTSSKSNDIKDLNKIKSTIERLKPITQSDYLENRSITPQTLTDALFYGKIKKGYNKMVIFPHWDERGLCGFEFKGDKGTGFSKYGYKGLWYSRIPKKLDQIIFVESPIEALSHYQAFHPENSAYFTASGNWSSNVNELIKKVIKKYEEAKVVAAFNNDRGGNRQASKLQQIAKELGRPNSIHCPPSIDQDWNDYIQSKKKQTIPSSKKLPFFLP